MSARGQRTREVQQGLGVPGVALHGLTKQLHRLVRASRSHPYHPELRQRGHITGVELDDAAVACGGRSQIVLDQREIAKTT